MNHLSISPEEFIAFRSLLDEMCGICLAENKAYLIESRLGALVHERGCSSYTEFQRLLKSGAESKLRDRVIDLMTTNETLWFRDRHPFRVLKDQLLPTYCQEWRDGCRSVVRIWSAACSTGQEPYSMAMVILEATRLNPEIRRLKFEIVASDISSTVLRLAKFGRYDNVSMSRGLPQELRDRYFKPDGRIWSIVPEVQQLITWKKHNLQEPFHAFGRFDVILCRNVAIYFSDGFKKDLFGRLASALNPNGFLFVGAAESIANYCDAFCLENGSAGVYRLQARTKMENGK